MGKLPVFLECICSIIKILTFDYGSVQIAYVLEFILLV